MRRAIDKDAAKHVLRKLIALAHQEMMNGDGDDEAAGDKVKEAMSEGSADEESSEPEALADGDEEGEESFSDYRKKEMKRGNKSPIKDRKVAVMMVKPKAVGGGKGRF